MPYRNRQAKLFDQLNSLWPALKTPGLTDEERDEIILQMVPIWKAAGALSEESTTH